MGTSGDSKSKTKRKSRKRTHSRKTIALGNYTEAEKARIVECERRTAGSEPPKLKQVEGGKGHELEIDGDIALFKVGLMEATGAADLGLSQLLVNQALRSRDGSGSVVQRANEVLAALHGIRPRDELEGMLTVQMVATHNLAMELTARAMLPSQTSDGLNYNVNRITKLMRTFTAQMEALNRYRGKGQQKVTVEHIHVNEGGQAIVGNVNPRGGGGDGSS